MEQIVPVEQPVTTQKYIFIDGSYFCFYRYHSIVNWWKNAHPTEPRTDLFSNAIFVEKFKKTFIETVKNIPKNLNILEGEEPILIVGKDCKRENIWRNAIYANYKGTRAQKDDFQGGPFFQLAYEEQLFQQGGASHVISYPTLEADDCIALSVKHLLISPDKNVQIYIITSDKDYLQLVEPRVKIFNLAFQNIAEQKSCIGDAQTELFCKIIMGDISDNISSVLKKCGPKTAIKCYQNKEYFEEKMKKENAYEKMELNRKMIDFNYIPDDLVKGFISNIIEQNIL